MLAAGAVTLFAADTPFRNRLLLDIVINRVTPVAERAGRPFEVIWWIERSPPVGPILDEIGSPDLISDIP